MMEGFKERQGDFVFTAKEQGEYRFCFENDGSGGFGSGGGEKMVDFEISVGLSSISSWTWSGQGGADYE